MKELTRQELDVYTGGDPGMVLAGGGWSGGGTGAGGFGSVGIGGFNLGFGDFDLGTVAHDVGGTAYTPAIAPNGLFGMSIAENLGVATGIGAVLTGLGQGWGASAAIEAAGGFSQIGTYGAAATGVGGSAIFGVGAAAVTGYAAGTLIYNSSPDWLQGILQDAVGKTVETIGAIPEAIPDAIVAINNWIIGVPSRGHGLMP
jgi:hypothetical protein